MSVSLLMTKKRRSAQQLEKPQFDFKVSETIHEETDNNDLDTEIECPSCQNLMTLNSAYDSRYYGCDDCNFCLYI
jgi:ssDNA-binding Zn-finger/Zn-ribbon topoisomerase 1